MSTFVLEADPHRFRDQVGPWLGADPALHTLPLSVLDQVCRGRYPEWMLARIEGPAGAVAALAVLTPPHNVIVAAADRQGVRRLAEGLAAAGRQLPGVTGVVPWVHDFAADWSALTGARVEEDKAERLFRLEGLVPPRPAEGTPRRATDADVDQLADWMRAFLIEVDLNEHLDARVSTETAVRDGRLYVWELDGEVVCDCGHSTDVAGQVRIGPVYTPPALRGRGYASSLVAHVTRLNLDRGLIPTLFTDLANPTSNHVYQALGYRAVSDAFMLRFLPPRDPSG